MRNLVAGDKSEDFPSNVGILAQRRRDTSACERRLAAAGRTGDGEEVAAVEDGQNIGDGRGAAEVERRIFLAKMRGANSQFGPFARSAQGPFAYFLRFARVRLGSRGVGISR